MKEFPEQRFVLEQLLEYFHGKRELTIQEIAEYSGCDPRTARKRYKHYDKAPMNIAVLAYRICEKSH